MISYFKCGDQKRWEIMKDLKKMWAALKTLKGLICIFLFCFISKLCATTQNTHDLKQVC